MYHLPQIHRIITLVLSCVILTSCMTGPNYSVPDLAAQMDDSWRSDKTPQSNPILSAEPVDTQWWKRFKTPELDNLISCLQKSNLSLAQAYQRIIQAKARAMISGTNNHPYINMSGKAMEASTGDNAFNFQGPPPGQSTEFFSLGVAAGWELDFWGRIKRQVESSNHDLEAELFNYRFMTVSMTAELASAYFNSVFIKHRLGLVSKHIQLMEQSLTLKKNKLDNGLATEQEVLTARQNLNKIKGQIPLLIKESELNAHRISILLGTSPSEKIPISGTIPELPSLVGMGVPADLLTRRADIRMAERKYAASVARIGMAMAEKYPRLSLSGTLAFQTDDAGSLIQSDSIIYSLGPELSFPLFDRKRINQNIRIRESQAESARLNVQTVLLNAVKDVEDALTSVIQSETLLDLKKTVLKDVVHNEGLSEQLFNTGLASKLQLIDAKLSRIIAEEAVITAEQDSLTQVIRLYRALGGGWEHLVNTNEHNHNEKGDGHNE